MVTCIVSISQAIYTQYCPFSQTYMSANLHHFPIHLNLMVVKYTAYTVYFSIMLLQYYFLYYFHV